MSSENSDNVVDAILLQDQIQVDREFHALIQPATPQELQQLEANLLAEGCRDALVTWRGLLLDGHNRLEICRRLGIAFRTVEVDLPDRDAARLWIMRNQLGRRNLSDDQRAMLAAAIVEEQSKANKVKRATAGAAGRWKPKECSSDTSADTERSDKQDARRDASRHARVSERKVRAALAIRKADQALAQKVQVGELTLTQAISQHRRTQKLQLLHKASTTHPRPQPSPDAEQWQVVTGDCIEQLKKQPAGSARLIFADPPYNIGIDYGDGHDDRRPDGEYLTWVAAWLAECRRVLADDGSLWVLICDEYAAEYAMSLKRLGLTLRNWIKWYETFGVNCTGKFNRTSRHLFYTVKDPKRLVFNTEPVTRPSDRQDKYGDKRASPGGKLWDDVWQIPRLVGTGSERLPEFPTQLPLKLLEPIVLCGTNPGDLIIDPFSGSGTAGEAAIRHGRRYLGIERSEKYAELSRLRLQGAKP